ncbi:MAG: DUF1552 domain-containing protein [Pirellulales bacterium]|nr:DUF1552 domain-containing protein [Pirellulales bacterium]
MTHVRRLSRRTVLRGVGTALSLPLLEAMLPARAFADGQPLPYPNRMAFFYVPNGVHMPHWTPSATGTEFELPPILEPLAPLRHQILVLSGLTADKARPNGDGPGDHARALAAFLTGCQPKKTDGADIRVGISVDQFAAARVGQHTRFPSLELGCEQGAQSGNCDSGYSCAYSSSASWKTESTPVAKEINPRLVFDRLFASQRPGESEAERARRVSRERSILDLVREDARDLAAQLGAKDRRKLDEYLTSVRELEQRINRASGQTPADVGLPRPDGIPADYAEHIRLMCDLLALAWQADLNRIATFLVANEGSNRSYAFINVPEGHHDLSHHGGNAEKQAKISKINVFHMTQFAHFLQRLAATPEGDGTLLDHAMIVYGSGIGDGNAHNHDNLPILVAGRGCGTLSPGRHVRYPRETPLNNLWLSMLDRVGAGTDRLGDSTGRLEDLSV